MTQTIKGCPALSKSIDQIGVHALYIIGSMLLVVFLTFNSLISVNHDESQYAAAAVLSNDYFIYRDFMSNQAPLHAWLFAPIAVLFKSWAFIAMRVATAVMSTLTVILVFVLQRRLSVCAGHAALIAVMLVCTQAFLFASGHVRNDILPAFLCAGGMVLLAMPSGTLVGRLAAGLLFGLAVSAKLSWAPMALSAFLYVICFQRRGAVPLVFGGLLGGVPLLIAFWVAPAGFLYGVLEHGATAPFDWYQQTGEAEKLTWQRKLISVANHSRLGAAPISAIAVAFFIAKRLKSLQERHWFLLIFCAGGFAGSLIPTPTHEQYLIPFYLVLFPLFGLILHSIPYQKIFVFLAILLSVYSQSFTLQRMLNNVSGGVTALKIRERAVWIDDQIRKTGQEGTIATLSAHLVTGTETKLDRGFATGPFIYRSGSLLSRSRARDLNAMIPARLNEEDFRPVAILTGAERSWGQAPAPDSSLDAFAASRGYKLMTVPNTQLRLWLRDGR